jgi:hypothetical protein
MDEIMYDEVVVEVHRDEHQVEDELHLVELLVLIL